MNRPIALAVLLLALGGALLAAPGDDKPPLPGGGLGTLKLYPSTESVGVLLNADYPPKVFLDGKFVGNYRDERSTPASFRLPAGTHKVRVEFGSDDYKPFESEVVLIGNETTQYLCVSLADE